MKRNRWLVIVPLLWSCACNEPHSTAVNESTDSVNILKKQSTKNVKEEAFPAKTSEQIGDSIDITFANNSYSQTVIGHIDTALSSVWCIFRIEKPKHLEAIITTPQEQTNIRFNQIFLPDGKADGPFGKKLSYDLGAAGEYKLRIGSSLMAEDPYVGTFQVEIKLQ